jgi:hypothetical protein
MWKRLVKKNSRKGVVQDPKHLSSLSGCFEIVLLTSVPIECAKTEFSA